MQRSEEINQPCFDRYFTYVVEELDAEWDDEGYLVALDLNDEKDYVGFTRYNATMDEAVCKHFGKEKCQKLAEAKGWCLETEWDGSQRMMNKEEGDDIFWWILHDELSKM